MAGGVPAATVCSLPGRAVPAAGGFIPPQFLRTSGRPLLLLRAGSCVHSPEKIIIIKKKAHTHKKNHPICAGGIGAGTERAARPCHELQGNASAAPGGRIRPPVCCAPWGCPKTLVPWGCPQLEWLCGRGGVCLPCGEGASSPKLLRLKGL